jgi:Transcriptional regulatory protein, C terminal
MEKPGRVFSRAQLLDGAWSHYDEIDDRTVDVHVGRLRKALSLNRERAPAPLAPRLPARLEKHRNTEERLLKVVIACRQRRYEI